VIVNGELADSLLLLPTLIHRVGLKERGPANGEQTERAVEALQLPRSKTMLACVEKSDIGELKRGGSNTCFCSRRRPPACSSRTARTSRPASSASTISRRGLRCRQCGAARPQADQDRTVGDLAGATRRAPAVPADEQCEDVGRGRERPVARARPARVHGESGGSLPRATDPEPRARELMGTESTTSPRRLFGGDRRMRDERLR
jgi:hypothetical protein